MKKIIVIVAAALISCVPQESDLDDVWAHECNPMNIPQSVVFNDGEALDENDLIALQRNGVIAVNDSYLSSLAQLSESDRFGLATTYAYAINIGGAIFADSVTPKRIRNCRGTILQRISSSAPDGATLRVLTYHVDEDEYAQVLPAAAAGLQRWDIITTQLVEITSGATARDFKDAVTDALSSQIVNKTKTVVATKDGSSPGFLVTPGTEVVSNPVEPATPAGHVKIAAVLVDDQAGNLIDPYSELRDYRIPLGCFIDSWQGGSDWVKDGNWTEGTIAISSNAAAAIASRIGAGGGHRRLLGFRMGATVQAAPMTIDLRRFGGISGSAQLLNISSFWPTTSTTWAELGLDAGGTFPLWGNGYTAGVAADIAGPGGSNSAREILGVRGVSGQAADVLYSGQFVWAGL